MLSGDKTRTVLRYSHLGVQFAILMIAPTAGGIWLDRRHGSTGLWTIAGAAAGFALGLYTLIRETRKVD